MLKQLHPQQFSRIEDSLSQLIGPASLDWPYQFETARDKISARLSQQNLKLASERIVLVLEYVHV